MGWGTVQRSSLSRTFFSHLLHCRSPSLRPEHSSLCPALQSVFWCCLVQYLLNWQREQRNCAGLSQDTQQFSCILVVSLCHVEIMWNVRMSPLPRAIDTHWTLTWYLSCELYPSLLLELLNFQFPPDRNGAMLNVKCASRQSLPIATHKRLISLLSWDCT